MVCGLLRPGGLRCVLWRPLIELAVVPAVPRHAAVVPVSHYDTMCAAAHLIGRQASQAVERGIRYGTVDCIEYAQLCQSMQIHQYPSVLYYNGSRNDKVIRVGPVTAHSLPLLQPYPFQGNPQNVEELFDHVATIRDNAVVSLTAEAFQQDVMGSSDIWLVDFFAPVCSRAVLPALNSLLQWCGHCVQMAPQFAKAARMVRGIAKFGTVDCVANSELCNSKGIQSFPTVWLYARNKSKRPSQFQDHHFADQIANFVRNQLKDKLVAFEPHMYESIKSKRESWLLVYGAQWCGASRGARMRP